MLREGTQGSAKTGGRAIYLPIFQTSHGRSMRMTCLLKNTKNLAQNGNTFPPSLKTGPT